MGKEKGPALGKEDKRGSFGDINGGISEEKGNTHGVFEKNRYTVIKGNQNAGFRIKSAA